MEAQAHQQKKKRAAEVKGWFLTYPKCPLRPQAVLDALRESVPGNPVRYWCISSELHKDGTPHVHAWIQYDRKTRFSADKWVIQDYRGQWQACQSPPAVCAYIRKDGDFIEFLPPSKEDINLGKRAQRNHYLLTAPVQDIINSGQLAALSLAPLMRARSIYHTLESKGTQKDLICYWIWGPPGAGKSYFVRSLHHPDELFIKSQTRWWDGWTPSYTAVLIDDFDKNGTCLSHHIKIWADRYPFPAEIKGSYVSPKYRALYITSNYRIEELWPDDEELQKAIKRRFHVYHMTDRDDPPDI